ncbi:MAG: amino acid adenylation domain-containing protein, partial [Algicola sp.]|nr:amino acid adenylation domain-containing protein [Algicola sp.]
PKGAMLQHDGLVNQINWFTEVHNLSSDDVTLQQAPYTFDISVLESFPTLTSGGHLALLKPDGHKDSQYLVELIQSAQVSKLHFVPSMLSALLAHQNLSECSSLQQVFCSGEALPLNLAKDFVNQCPKVQLHNLYGPTEAAIDVSHFSCNDVVNKVLDGRTSIPIGRPIQNIQLYVLNKQAGLVPIGTEGELHIGGVGLARGYLNLSDLTEAQFIANPFYDAKNTPCSERLYKTGDLVRWLPEGNLEFLGRIDHQVKIRGFRIELGEIEHILADHPDVNETVVQAMNLASGDMGLVAYVVSSPARQSLLNVADSTADDEQVLAARQDFIDQLQRHVSEQLPQYMVPAAFVFMAQLPLTANGKLDRKALPEPDMNAQQAVYVAPSTDNEKVMSQVWQQVLGLKQVGINDNFFELGGHSLLVIQVISRLQDVGIVMTARQLFDSATLADLSRSISAENGGVVFSAPENLIPLDGELITPAMLPLLELSEEDLSRIVSQVPGGAGNIQDIYPLGPLQEGILFHHMMSSQGDPYVMPMLFEVKSEQAVDAFLSGLQFVVNRHDVLRTAVLWDDLPVAVQVVCREVSVPVTRLEAQPEQDVAAHMQALCAPEVQQMDLGLAPLLSVKIMADPLSGLYFLLVQFHHIISDHVGLEIIVQEVLSYQRGETQALATPMPFREFIAHTQYQAEHHDAERYFSEVFGDIDEPTLPFNLSDVQGDGSRIIEVREAIPAPISAQLRGVAKRLKVSPAALFHTAWAMLVGACSGRDDVVFGTIVSGRLQGTAGALHTVGVFINTLPLRVKLANLSVSALVKQVQRSLTDLLPYEQASLALVQQCTSLVGDTPLFSAMLNYRHSAPADDTAMDELESAADTAGPDFTVIGGQERTNFPFNLSVDDWGDGFGLDVQIDSSLDAQRITDYIQTVVAGLVNALAATPTMAAQHVSILPQSERQQLLVQYNTTHRDYPTQTCVHEVFEAQVARAPGAIAVKFEDQQLTYDQLNRRANQLADYLVTNLQVKPDTLVGICLERSLDMIIAILAVLKAGGAYVPLDPDYPASRLSYLLDDSKLKTVITQSSLLAKTPISQAQALCLDGQAYLDCLPTLSDANLPVQSLGLTPNHLAYVIYTSGSTGQPKGVLIEHISVVRLVINPDFMCLDNQTVMLQCANIAFDAATLEIWGPLLNGGQSILYPHQHLSLVTLNSVIERYQVNVLWLTAGLFSEWSYDVPASSTLKTLLAGGDVLDPQAIERVQQSAPALTLINGYGPTENTTFSTTYTFEQPHTRNIVPIGKKLSTDVGYILNEAAQLVPDGSIGELCVGGDGLARGYLNRPELTAERFIDNPFYEVARPDSSPRLYRTGDLVRYLPDGNLAFIGRADEQVKIRGFRVELGEIEQTLNTLEQVNGAVVLFKENSRGEKQLIAYVVLEKGVLEKDVNETDHQQTLTGVYREALSHRLPDHMVPAIFVELAQLPITVNGKIDRKALNALEGPDLGEVNGEHVAPGTDVEKRLCAIWQTILEVEQVGITDNFFTLGGQSLLATRLSVQIGKEFDIKVELRELFEKQTIAELGKYVERELTIKLALETNVKNVQAQDDEEEVWEL